MTANEEDTGSARSSAVPHKAIVRTTGLFLGLAIVSAVLISSRVPGGTGTLGAHVIIASSPNAELTLEPLGPVIRATGLTPDEAPTQGTLRVYNQTGSALHLQLRGVPSTDELDALLWVEVVDGPQELFKGSLGEFRDWTPEAMRVDSGAWEALTVRTWLDQGDGWAGRDAEVSVEFQSVGNGGTA